MNYRNLCDIPPVGKPGDLAEVWADPKYRGQTGTIIEVRPSKYQRPDYCYVMYVYRIRFENGIQRTFRACDCTVKKRGQENGET